MANEFHICVIKSEDFDQLLTEYLQVSEFVIVLAVSICLKFSKYIRIVMISKCRR